MGRPLHEFRGLGELSGSAPLHSFLKAAVWALPPGADANCAVAGAKQSLRPDLRPQTPGLTRYLPEMLGRWDKQEQSQG